MIRKLAFLLAVLMCGCNQANDSAGDNEQANSSEFVTSSEEPTTPDPPAEWQWSEEKIRATEQKARNGDIVAARSLYTYYGINDNIPKYREWEVWLVDRKDSEAILVRSEWLFSKSFDFPVGSQKRIQTLEESKRLVKEWLSLNPSAENSLEREFLGKIQRELSTAKGS